MTTVEEVSGVLGSGMQMGSLKETVAVMRVLKGTNLRYDIF